MIGLIDYTMLPSLDFKAFFSHNKLTFGLAVMRSDTKLISQYPIHEVITELRVLTSMTS